MTTCGNSFFSRLHAGEVSEAALVRDILYVFQGIDGKFIKMSAQDNCYKIDGKVLERASAPVLLGQNSDGKLGN